MTVYYINPSLTTNGNGTLAKPFNSWNGIVLAPGNSYLQKAGTIYTGSLMITTTSLANIPLQIGSYGIGLLPIIKGTVNFSGAEYAVISGLEIIGGNNAAAVVIQAGSNNVEVSNCAIHDSQIIGVWLGNNVGNNNVVQANQVYNNKLYGIALSKIRGKGTAILGNTISNNGSHGIEIQGEFITVQNNKLYNNCVTVSGSSGIHVFGVTNSIDSSNNKILHNIVFNSHDNLNQDGNGIELDQYTQNNLIQFNFVFGCDGAGIVIYDAWNNHVLDNTLVANAINSGNTHSVPGELVVFQSLGLSAGNIIQRNRVLGAGRNTVTPAVRIDPTSAKLLNVFGANIFQNGLQPIYNLDNKLGSDLTHWNAVANGVDSFGALPITTTPSADVIYLPPGIRMTINGSNKQIIAWSTAGFVVA